MELLNTLKSLINNKEIEKCKNIIKEIGVDKKYNGKKLLHLSVASDDSLNLIKLLFELGAKINDVDDNNMTPIYLAVFNKKIAYIEYLMTFNPDLTYLINNETVLHYAIRQDLTDYVFNMIKKENMKDHQKIQDKDGMNILHLACSLNRIFVCCMLIDYGMDPCIKSKNKRNAMDYCNKNLQTILIELAGKRNASLYN